MTHEQRRFLMRGLLTPRVACAGTVLLFSAALLAGGCYGDPATKSAQDRRTMANRRPGKAAGAVGANSSGGGLTTPLSRANIARKTQDVLEYELLPSYSGNYDGARFTTNQWGMRDKEYEERPSTSTYRIALLGAAYTMAPGVDEPQSFQAVLEDELNAESRKKGSPERYEVLNFGVSGYSVLQHLAVLDQKVWKFQPNAVLVVFESNELKLIGNSLIRIAHDSAQIPYPYLTEAFKRAGVSPGLSETEAAARFRPLREAIELWGLKEIADRGRKKGVPVLAAVLPRAGREGKDMDQMLAVSSGVAASGLTVLHVDDVFEGRATNSLKPATGFGASSLAHRLIAGALLSELQKAPADPFHLSTSNKDGRTRQKVSRPAGE